MKLFQRLSVGGILLLGSSVWGSEQNVLNLSYKNVSPYSATLNWTNLSESDIQRYKVFCNDKLLFTTVNQSYDFNSLVPNQNYTFKVQAIDAEGNEIQGNAVTFKTLAMAESNFFLLNSYAFDKFGAKVSYFDGVKAAMDELYPDYSDYLRKYDDPQKWYDFYDIKARTPYKTEFLNNINFSFYEGDGQMILNSGKDKFAAVTFDGFLVAAEDGDYAFKVEHDNSFILEIDGREVVNEMKYKSPKEYTLRSVKLLKGVHRVKITYYEFSGVKSSLLMQWAGPNFDFRPLDGYSFVQLKDAVNPYLATDADFDGVLDSVEAEKNSSNSSWDTDNDGLTDYEEIVKFNSKPDQRDTDNDGIEDAIEAKIAKTNLTTVDNNNNENFFSNVQTDIQNDKLTLSWNYNGSNINEYKVFRNFNEVGSTRTKAFTLPILSEDDFYYIVAVNTDGKRNFKRVNPITLTAEQKAYLVWKINKGLPQSSTFDKDFDKDFRSNLNEYKLDSNPRVEPLPTIASLEKLNGLIAEYHDTIWSPTLLDELDTYKVEILDSLNFNAGEGEVLNSGKINDVGVIFKGFFNAPETGLYKFLISYDDYLTIYIDDTLFFKDTTWNPNGTFFEKHLASGIHSIRVEYGDGHGEALLDVKWQKPSDEKMEDMADGVFWHVKNDKAKLREYIAWSKDSDGDGVSNEVEFQNGTNINSKDSDNDGLTDFEELNKYHTDPNKADSDGDGVNDGDEVKKAFSDPNKVDFNSETKLLQVINGNSFVEKVSNWGLEGDCVYAMNRNGALSYNLNIPQDGYYALEVELSEHNTLLNNSVFVLGLNINDVPAVYEEIKTSKYETKKALIFLPYLKEGIQKISLKWINSYPDTSLKIHKLALLELLGPDNNNNNRPDWVDNRVNSMLSIHIPKTTKFSPAFIEGDNGYFVQNYTITGAYKADENDLDPIAVKLPNNGWYVDVKVNPEQTTNIAIDLNNGTDVITQNIDWIPCNILCENEIVIRKGAELKVSAVPEGQTGGQSLIKFNGESQYTTKPVIFKFNETGEFNINASWSKNGAEGAEGNLKVIVKDAQFSATPFAVVEAFSYWHNPSIKDDIFLSTEDNIYLRSDDNEDQIRDIEFISNKVGDVVFATRLYKNGPVISTSIVDVIANTSHKTFGYLPVLQTYSDGSKLLEGNLAFSKVDDSIKIKITINTSGAIFEDGTTEKVFTKADFDESGVLRYRIIKSAESPSSICSSAEVYVNGEKVETILNI